MHVKTYTGSSTSAVLASIKADLGADAVILDTRETGNGTAAEITITAAVARKEASASGEPGNGSGAARTSFAVPGGPPAAYAGMGWKSWQEEWAAIRTHLLALMKPELQLSRLAPRQRAALEFLEREGVDASALLTVFETLLPDPQASILAPLADLVPVRAWGAKTWPQRVHLIGGPFGAGKTTALVRLALLLQKSMPGGTIWVVNADCRRGGGRLLLKNYANLCELVYREADNAVDFARILAEARTVGVDRILVDLPGLPRGRSMPDLLDFFGMSDPENALHLTVPPHTGDAGMQSLLTRYLPGNGARPASLVWTKLDEASQFGCLVNAGAAFRVPVSALSCGPELSGTLVPAEEAALWRLLFKQEMPCPAYSANSGF